MKPRDLRPGHVILTFVRERKPLELKVTDVEPCPYHRRGVGRTHINGSNCYDNAADVTVK